jgi:hypothetical protein
MLYSILLIHQYLDLLLNLIKNLNLSHFYFQLSYTLSLLNFYLSFLQISKYYYKIYLSHFILFSLDFIYSFYKLLFILKIFLILYNHYNISLLASYVLLLSSTFILTYNRLYPLYKLALILLNLIKLNGIYQNLPAQIYYTLYYKAYLLVLHLYE